jgi:hypothetical protein
LKSLLAVAIAILVTAPAGFAIGQARDPRVAGLQQRLSNAEECIGELLHGNDQMALFGGKPPRLDYTAVERALGHGARLECRSGFPPHP